MQSSFANIENNYTLIWELFAIFLLIASMALVGKVTSGTFVVGRFFIECFSQDIDNCNNQCCDDDCPLDYYFNFG